MTNLSTHEPGSIRVLPDLRATQVEQSYLFTPAQHLYFSTNYDLEGTPIPDDFLHVGLISAVRYVFRSKAQVLEVPEPMWVRFLPTNIAVIAAWRVSGLLRLKNRKARTYAIENNSPERAIFGDMSVPRWLRRAAVVVLGAVYGMFYEKAVFGTHGAAAAYASLPLSRKVRTEVFPELPTAVDRDRTSRAAAAGVIFVGWLDSRKGIHSLMEAWPSVETLRPNAQLTVVGDGPLREKVAVWASERPQSRRFLGRLPHNDTFGTIETASILVAPSQVDGRWREQVGLPIVEAISLGLTVVTSEDTGLAQWLDQTGHFVIPDARNIGALTATLVRALDTPLPIQSVLDSLPTRTGRVDADNWLHSDR